jgi:cyclophilin family peptidyl-prolyl cis-trans isomerase
MALSGKDTGGSQYFFTHSAQPHLDGGYTVFGQLDADDRQIANRVLQGERIHWVRVVDVHPDVEPEGSAQ